MSAHESAKRHGPIRSVSIAVAGTTNLIRLQLGLLPDCAPPRGA